MKVKLRTIDNSRVAIWGDGLQEFLKRNPNISKELRETKCRIVKEGGPFLDKIEMAFSYPKEK